MLISKKKLKEMVLYSYAHIDRLQDERSPYYDPSFPKKVKVGDNRIGFVLAEVEHYVQAKIEQRDSSA
jgi:prophage regulatory protein